MKEISCLSFVQCGKVVGGKTSVSWSILFSIFVGKLQIFEYDFTLINHSIIKAKSLLFN